MNLNSTRRDGTAFGKPGIEPRWTGGNKDAVGTAYSSSSCMYHTSHSLLLSHEDKPYHVYKLFFRMLLFSSVCCALTSMVVAQKPVGQASEQQKPPVSTNEEISQAPAKVGVKHVARDEEIRKRLQSVLDATDWFTDPQVRVEEGVVFLSGRAESADLKKWAGDLASNTQDVVAVANRMEVPEPPVWDFRSTWSGLLVLRSDFIRSLSFFALGLLILAPAAGTGMLATGGARAFLHRRIRANPLRNVIARGIGVLVFLFGLYIVLRLFGLTQLALTVVGGTGLIGLAVGIAFRDITENFLASIFLSIQRPFEMGDLVEVAGVTGYVEQLNVRTTILMTHDGNLVQIPNVVVYKSYLRNFTTSSNRREDFVVGIGYDDSINDAQEIARKVLADSLGKATINLRVYFWLNSREQSWLKVRSSVIRLVKLAFQKHGISMPTESREIVFPHGIPVTVLDGQLADAHVAMPGKGLPPESQHEELAAVSTKAEAGLYSEAVVIEEQARQAQLLKGGENLLPVASDTPTSEKQTKEPQP